MVQINVSQQLKAPIGSTRNHVVNEIVDIAHVNSPVQGEGRLMRTDRSLLTKARIQTMGELTVRRRLILFSYPLTLIL